jgi:hypothetical protein
VALLPSNVTSFCQPTDQGITESEHKYRRRVVQSLTEVTKTRNCIQFEQINPALFFYWTAKTFERSAMAHSLRSPLEKRRRGRGRRGRRGR